MEIDTTRIRYHLTLTSMATIKIKNRKQVLQGCVEIETLVRCWWKSRMVRLLGTMAWRFLRNTETEWPHAVII